MVHTSFLHTADLGTSRRWWPKIWSCRVNKRKPLLRYIP